FRKEMLRMLTSMAQTAAPIYTAMLTFGYDGDAEEMLSAFRFEQRVESASLYDENGNLFAFFPQTTLTNALPALGKDGGRVDGSHIIVFAPVMERGVRKGTLCLICEIEAPHQFVFYAGFAVSLLSVCFL